jgi:hypothetical protein
MVEVVLSSYVRWGDKGVHIEGSLGSFLQPCPLCGGEDLVVSNTHTACYRVICQHDGCGVELLGKSFTKIFRTKKTSLEANAKAMADACRRWNRRGGEFDSTAAYYRRAIGNCLRGLAGRSP